jgi:hypothetical protein
MTRLEIVVLVAALLLMAFTLEVLRRRRLSESYALLWLGVGLGALVLGLARPLVDRVSEALGIAYGTSLVFGVGLVFLLAVCINLSIHVSNLESRVEVLAEEVALLRGPVGTAATDPAATDPATAEPGAADAPEQAASAQPEASSASAVGTAGLEPDPDAQR